MIQNLRLYTSLSSTGSYALLVKLWTRNGIYRASVPIKDANPQTMKMIRSSFTSLRSNFVGLNEEDWLSFDSMLRQFSSKTVKLNPALTLGMSIASGRASSDEDLWKLNGPTGRFPCIAGVVAAGKSWKEFIMIPHRERSVMDAYRMLLESWRVVGEELRDKGVLRGRNMRGAWLSDLGDVETLYLVDQVARDWNMDIGINVGASALWNGSNYQYANTRSGVIKRNLNTEEHLSMLSAVIEHYRIAYIEDPFRTGDYMNPAKLVHRFENMMVSGNMLYRGDTSRMKRSHRFRPTNTVTVDPVDLVSVSHLQDISSFVKEKKMKLVISSGRLHNEDAWMTDLAVAFGADMIKLGITGAANTSKYNRLLEIWDDAPSPVISRIGLE